MKTPIPSYRWALAVVFAVVFSASALQGAEPARGRLPPDYYARDNGVLGKEALGELLAARERTPEDWAKLQRVLESSTERRFREIGRSIEHHKTVSPPPDSLALLVDLRTELWEERQKIIRFIVDSITNEEVAEPLSNLLFVAVTSCHDAEVKTLLGTLPVVIKQGKEDFLSMLFPLVRVGIKRKTLSKEDLAGVEAVITDWLKQRPVDASRDMPDQLLVQIGGPAGTAIVEQKIAEALKPSASMTDLSMVVPTLLQYMTTPLGMTYIDTLPAIGEGVKRAGHEKLTQGFFHNVNGLMMAAQAQDNQKAIQVTRKFLEAAAASNGDDGWRAKARALVEAPPAK